MAMTEYTVHFEHGPIGARRLRMIQVEAETPREAMVLATALGSFGMGDKRVRPGWRITRVDHFENGALVIDC